MGRPKGSKNKKGLIPFEPTHEWDIIKEFPDGSFIGANERLISKYRASLKTLGKWYYAEGNTALEAIQNLKSDIAKGIGVLIVEKDGKKVEKVIGRPLMFKLFGQVNAGLKDLAIKQITQTFNL